MLGPRSRVSARMSKGFAVSGLNVGDFDGSRKKFNFTDRVGTGNSAKGLVRRGHAVFLSAWLLGVEEKRVHPSPKPDV